MCKLLQLILNKKYYQNVILFKFYKHINIIQ